MSALAYLAGVATPFLAFAAFICLLLVAILEEIGKP